MLPENDEPVTCEDTVNTPCLNHTHVGHLGHLDDLSQTSIYIAGKMLSLLPLIFRTQNEK